jgi:hypothetical protein
MELLLKKKQNQTEARNLIPQLLWHIEECRRSPLIRFQELARTLKRWLEPVARMWRFTKNVVLPKKQDKIYAAVRRRC